MVKKRRDLEIPVSSYCVGSRGKGVSQNPEGEDGFHPGDAGSSGIPFPTCSAQADTPDDEQRRDPDSKDGRGSDAITRAGCHLCSDLCSNAYPNSDAVAW